jgi:hypothetical protein
MNLPVHAPSSLSPPILGRWRQGTIGRPRKRSERLPSLRCMTCQILIDRQRGDQLAVDTLANRQMLINLAAWRARKGWAP